MTKGIQIWNLITEFSPSNGNNDADKQIDNTLQIYQDMGTAASGMLLLFASGFVLFSIFFIRKLPETHRHCRLLSWGVGILATSFLGRNAVIFAFTLIYSQYNNVASLGAQLVYMVLYGISSVVVYACIVWIAAAQEKEPSALDEPVYAQVQSAFNDGLSWQQEKSSVNVSTNAYTDSYGSYLSYSGERNLQ